MGGRSTSPHCQLMGWEARSAPPASLQVLTRVDDSLDAAKLFFGLAHEGFDVHDPLALLAGDLGPVIGVGGVGQILVLLELLADGGEEVVDHDALLAPGDVALEGELLGAAHDGFDHGAGGEVLEVEDFFIAVGVGDLEEAIFLAEAVHGLHGGGDHGGDDGGGVAAAGFGLGEGDVGGEVLGEDVGGGAAVGPLDLDFHVEAAGAQDGRIDEVLAVGGADDDDVFEALDAVDFGQELGHDGGLDVGGDAGAAGAEEGVHFIEEDDDGDVLGGLFLGLDEDFADLAFGFADVLVEELGALDVEEEALDLLAAFFGDLFGEVVGDGLGDHGFAAAGGPVEEHALGGGELVLFVVVGVEVRQLDGILDGRALVAEAADVLVAGIGDLLGLEGVDLDGRVEVDLHLAALGEDGDGAVLVGGQVDAVGRGRGAELVDLFLERRDLLARLVERVHELLVLIERLHELPVRLAELVLEDHEILGCVLELFAEMDGLRLERPDVCLEVLHLDLVLRETAASARIGHGRRKELREALATGATLLVELLHSPSLLT